MLSKFSILFLLILLSAIFSGSETALVALTHAKIRAMIRKDKRAKYVIKLKENPSKLLVTILLGNNLVNIGASVYAAVVFTQLWGSRGIGIAMGVMTFLVLVFGEITPKSFAQKYCLQFSLFVAHFLIVVEFILWPLIWLLEKLIKTLMKIFGIKEKIKSMTEEELKALVSIGAEEGAIEKHEKKLIENVLEFNDITVEEVMTPRARVEALPITTTLRHAGEYILEHIHTRIPVYKDSIDNIVGVITVKEILHHTHKEDLDNTLEQLEDLKKPYVVPQTMRISVLLRELNNKRTHIAIVVDEHGGTAGVVTLEDLLEEIVGDIVDENDIEEEMLTKIDKNTIITNGKTPIYEINEFFGVKLDFPDFKPVSFLILEELHRFPKRGERIAVGGLFFTVTEMKKYKIEKVKVEKKK